MTVNTAHLDSDRLDLGRLALVGESFATPENRTAVTIIELGAAPTLRDDFRSWEFITEDTRVVLVDVSDGIGHPAGVIEHFTSSLGVPASELESCDPYGAEGSVLLIEGPEGPFLVGFVTTAGTSTPAVPHDRRKNVDDAIADGLLSLGVLREVPLEVSAELGHTRLSVAEILQLNIGSVIELDRTAGAPIDVVVNGSLIAHGEVVVIDDEYGVRITEIVGRVGDAI